MAPEAQPYTLLPVSYTRATRFAASVFALAGPQWAAARAGADPVAADPVAAEDVAAEDVAAEDVAAEDVADGPVAADEEPQATSTSARTGNAARLRTPSG